VESLGHQQSRRLALPEDAKVKALPGDGWEEDLIRKGIVKTLTGREQTGVVELLEEVSRSLGCERSRVARALRALEDDEVVELSESKRLESFPAFLASPNSAWSLGAMAAVVVSLFLVIFPSGAFPSLSEPLTYLRYFFGSSLVLFLPGYSLMRALFPKASPFSDLATIALSIGSSLAFSVMIGFVLGQSPLKLETLSISVSLAAFTLALLLAGSKRRFDYYRLAGRVTQSERTG